MKRTAKMLTAALLALTLALPGTAAAADDTPAVRISEMMYKNHATLQDADGDFSDWFELENTSNRVVRLKGWSVSDGKTVWDFPADATIPRGGVRVVFASRKDKTAAGESHTSFALGEGETLYLIAPGGTIADRAACDPELPADHVLRRENGGELTESVWATPGYPNTAAGYAAFCESRKTESPLVLYEAAVYNDTFALKGEYYDWVEIKNVSKESVKLSDYCLSDDRRELDIIAHDAGGEGADVHLTLDAEVVDAGLERDDRGKAVQNAGRCPADGVAELRTSAEGTLDDQLCGVDRVFTLRADQQRADEKHADEGHDVTHDADLPLKGKDLSTLKRVEIHITCYHFRALLTSAGRFPCRFSLYTYHRRKARRCR